MLRCTKEDCEKEAEYMINGYSVCNEHKNGKKPEEKENRSMADQMVGNIENPV